MSTHTPGPWTVETVQTACGICYKVGPFPGKREGDKPRHACLYADYPSKGNPADDELKANARLIAAAPDLLQALAELVAVKDLKDRTEALHFAGPNGAAGGDWEAEYKAGRKEYIQRQPAAWDAARAAIAKAEGRS